MLLVCIHVASMHLYVASMHLYVASMHLYVASVCIYHITHLSVIGARGAPPAAAPAAPPNLSRPGGRAGLFSCNGSLRTRPLQNL